MVNMNRIATILIIIVLALMFSACHKINLSEIETNCYYIAQFDDDTYILKFDSISEYNIIGKSYKVGKTAIAEEKSLTIVAGRKECEVSINDTEFPSKITPTIISKDSVIGEYSVGKEKKKFCIYKYKEPSYKEVESQFQKEKYKVSVKRDIVYGSAKGFWSYNPEKKESFAKSYVDKLGEAMKYNVSPRDLSLKLDIYTPQDDTCKLRPLLMLIHGGAFFNGDKASEAYEKWSNHFAAMGFVVASINYRMGFLPSAGQIDRAGYRAVQDAHAAMRYMVHNAATYRINTDWIFAGGTSAGAITALNLAFMRNNNRPKTTKGTALRDDLGDIESVSSQYKDKFSIRAVANMWGAVHDISMIANAKTSIISFHGDADNIVPYGYDYPFKDILDPIKMAIKNSSSLTIRSFARTMNLSMPLNKAITNKMYGSYEINKKAKALGNRSKLYTTPGGGHSLHVDKNNKLVPYFYFIQDSVTSFFIDELIPKPAKIVHDKNDALSYYISGGNIKDIYWKAENGIILSTAGRKARIIFLPAACTKRVIVSGHYSNGIGFRKEIIIRK